MSEPQTHSEFDELDCGEIGGAIIRDLHGLEELKLPSTNMQLKPSKVWEHIKERKSNKLYDNCAWLGFPTVDTPPSEGSTALEIIFNRICIAARFVEQKHNRPRRGWSSRYSEDPIPHKDYARKPCLVLMHEDAVDKPDADWSNILAVAEVGIGDSKSKHSILEDLAEDVVLIFENQPDRFFVLGIAICNTEMALAVFNRGGLAMGNWFDVHRQPTRFIHLIVGLTCVDRIGLGFDPRIDLTDVDGPSSRTVTVERTTFFVVGVIIKSQGIRGRSTLCLIVTREGETYVFKNAWIVKQKSHLEGSFHHQLDDLEGFPKAVKFEQATLSGLKEGGKLYTTITDLEKLKSQMDSSQIAQLYSDEWTPLVPVRMVVTPLGSSIRNFKSRRELFYALITIVEALEGLHDRRVVHRDISINNILLGIAENEHGERRGLVIDFDMAADSDNAAVAYHIGTLPYMPIEVLARPSGQSVVHRYDHDLESLFYVMCHLFSSSVGPNGLGRNAHDLKRSGLGRWFEVEGEDEESYQLVAEFKMLCCNSADAFNEIIFGFTKYFNDDVVYECMQALRELLFSSRRNVLVKMLGDQRDRRNASKIRRGILIRKTTEFFRDYRSILLEAYRKMGEPNAEEGGERGLASPIDSEAEPENDINSDHAEADGLSQERRDDDFANFESQSPAVGPESAVSAGGNHEDGPKNTPRKRKLSGESNRENLPPHKKAALSSKNEAGRAGPEVEEGLDKQNSRPIPSGAALQPLGLSRMTNNDDNDAPARTRIRRRRRVTPALRSGYMTRAKAKALRG